MNVDIFKPIYIWRPVLDVGPVLRLAADLGLAPCDWPPHLTVASSISQVDWRAKPFLPETGHIVIRPQRCAAIRFGASGEYLSIILDLPDIRDRHYVLRENGADYAYVDFRPHLTFGRAAGGELPATICIEVPIRLGPEERKVPVAQAATA